jgi:hypothetical protein
MPTIKLSHEIHCDEETFWKLFLDREYNEKLYKEGLDFPDWSIVEQRETDTEFHRTTKGSPRIKNVPGPVAKILGDGFGYTETGSMKKSERIWRYRLVPSTMPDKIKQEGTVRIETVAPGKIRRVVELTLEVKIFGIGGMVEATTEKQLRDGWDASAAYLNAYIAKTKA